MKTTRLGFFAAAALSSLALASVTGCSPSSSSTLSGGSGGNVSGGSGNGGASAGSFSNGAGNPTNSTGSTQPCSGLSCQIHTCSGGGSTTITGTIYDPAGKNPLYGVVAYVPNSPPAAFTKGASCASCSDLYTGDPIAAAVTDAKGQFTIKNAPDGMNIPLVIQVGKWRRQITIPSVGMCTDTPIPGNKITLPKNGSEGDIPEMAISTGGADTLECLLSRIGVDKSEYVGGAGGNGHIHIFQGVGGDNTSPGGPASSQGLWSSKAELMKYDIVILSCEGNETANMNQQALFDYAQAGGRVFASHFHYSWFNTGPFGSGNLAQWFTGSNNVGNLETSIVTTTWAGQPFIRGQAMHDWLQNVNALQNNRLPIQAARHNADVTMANTPSQPWVIAAPGQPNAGSSQDFTFDTPLGAAPEKQCGRVAYSDMHVGAASGDNKGVPTPQECANQDLSAQEKALEFIFFDLSSCVTPNNMPMMPPGNPPM